MHTRRVPRATNVCDRLSTQLGVKCAAKHDISYGGKMTMAA